MDNKELKLSYDGKDVVIKKSDYNTFEDLYQLGMLLEQIGFTDEGFAGKQKFAPKYLNWAKVVRIMNFLDENFEWKEVKFTSKELVGDQLVDVERPFYKTDKYVSFVGIEFTFKGKVYYQEQPIMAQGNFSDVEIVQATRVNFSQRRALVKGVAEHLGLGLHLWTKEEVAEYGAVEETTPAKVAKVAPKPVVKKEAAPQVAIKVETPKNDIKKPVEETTILPPAKTVVKEVTKEVVKEVRTTALTDAEFENVLNKVKAALVSLSTTDPKHIAFVKELTTNVTKKYAIAKLSDLPKTKEVLLEALVNPIKEYKAKEGIK